MTPEAQQIAIAEFCGWTHIHSRYDPDDARLYLSGKHPKGENWGALDEYYKLEVPNYPGSLDAMHNAEKSLSRVQEWDSNGERLLTQWDKYCQHLKYRIDATSAQRAEAFLRTVGKWQEAAP